jgi:hypothetical protein
MGLLQSSWRFPVWLLAAAVGVACGVPTSERAPGEGARDGSETARGGDAPAPRSQPPPARASGSPIADVIQPAPVTDRDGQEGMRFAPASVGVDYPFNDISGHTGYSEDDCRNACLAAPECVGFVIGTGTDAGACWLKSRWASGGKHALRNSFMRSNVALSVFTSVEPETDDAGEVLATLQQDAQGCAQECANDARCVGFVTSPNLGCALKGLMQRSGTCVGCVRYCAPGRGPC